MAAITATAMPAPEPASPITMPWATTMRRMSAGVPPVAMTRPRVRVWRRALTANAVPASRTISRTPKPTTSIITAIPLLA